MLHIAPLKDLVLSLGLTLSKAALRGIYLCHHCSIIYILLLCNTSSRLSYLFLPPNSLRHFCKPLPHTTLLLSNEELLFFVSVWEYSHHILQNKENWPAKSFGSRVMNWTDVALSCANQKWIHLQSPFLALTWQHVILIPSESFQSAVMCVCVLSIISLDAALLWQTDGLTDK